MEKNNKRTIWIIVIAAAIVAIGLLVYFLFFFKNKNVRNAETAIEEIGTVSIESGADIENARELYDGLTDSEKNKVENLKTLECAEEEYEELCDRAAAEEVDELIEEIGEVDRDSEKRISKAREAYDDLTKKQRKYVENLDDLEEAEEEFKYLDVKECEELIDDIQDAADSPDIELPIAISAARSAYDALSASHKEKVSNYDNLEAAEAAYEEYANKKDALKIKQEHAKRLEDIQEYCNSCQSITYAQLSSNPDTYEGKDIAIKVDITKVEEGAFLKSETIIAKPTNGKADNYMVLNDKRSVKEPELKAGLSATVYGEFVGVDKEGRPEINVNYTSADDEEAIDSKPTTTEVFNYIEEGIGLAKDVTDVLKLIPW